MNPPKQKSKPERRLQFTFHAKLSLRNRSDDLVQIDDLGQVWWRRRRWCCHGDTCQHRLLRVQTHLQVNWLSKDPREKSSVSFASSARLASRAGFSAKLGKQTMRTHIGSHARQKKTKKNAVVRLTRVGLSLFVTKCGMR